MDAKQPADTGQYQRSDDVIPDNRWTRPPDTGQYQRPNDVIPENV